MNQIRKKAEYLETKILLNRLKTILLNERLKSYYRSEMNVKETIFLQDNTKLIIYENDMIDITKVYTRKLIK